MSEAQGDKRKIGFIGLGLMGRPMAANLLKAGHSLTVWNRTAARAQELVAAGAKLASTPREVAAASDILFTIVSDPPALEEVLWGHEGKHDGALEGLRKGSVYIDSSTISPALAKKTRRDMQRARSAVPGCAGYWRRLGRERREISFLWLAETQRR